MKRIRGGRGIGDGLYVYPVVKYLVDKGEKLEVCTDWPEIYTPVKDKVKFSPHSRHNIDYIAHYSKRKKEKTSQYEDVSIQALGKVVEMKMDWNLQGDWDLDKPLMVVQMPRIPMDRKDGFGRELAPDFEVMDRILGLCNNYNRVLVGKGRALYNLQNIDLDLTQRSVTDLLDIASLADAFVGQCSFVIPLAELFDKPLLVPWSHKTEQASNYYLKRIVPEKIFHKKTSHHVYDNWDWERIENKVYEVFDLRGVKAPLSGQISGNRRLRAECAG